MTRFFVVSANPKDRRENWTISPRPDVCGWETDSGQDGYGLPKELAEWIVDRINEHKPPFECELTTWGEWTLKKARKT